MEEVEELVERGLWDGRSSRSSLRFESRFVRGRRKPSSVGEETVGGSENRGRLRIGTRMERMVRARREIAIRIP